MQEKKFSLLINCICFLLVKDKAFNLIFILTFPMEPFLSVPFSNPTCRQLIFLLIH